MLFRVLVILSIAGVAFAAPEVSQASSSKSTKVQVQLKRFYHASGVIKCIGAVAHRTIYSSTPRIRYKWRHAVRWLIGVREDARRKLASLRAPPVQPVGHYALWNCIHLGVNGGGARWGQGEGTGYNGQYTGPLQMSHNWAGYSVWDWNTVSIGTVYADAEEQYSRNNYSTSWLQGQWPETAAPCLQYA